MSRWAAPWLPTKALRGLKLALFIYRLEPTPLTLATCHIISETCCQRDLARRDSDFNCKGSDIFQSFRLQLLQQQQQQPLPFRLPQQQQQPQARMALQWRLCSAASGMRIGEASHPGPLHVKMDLGTLTVSALVDTGSDYDAIDADLSGLQETKYGNPGFIERRETATCWVGGYCSGMQQQSSAESDWFLGVFGSQTWDGPPSKIMVKTTLTEFRGLGDPVIIGMPSIDQYGGMEVTGNRVWVLGSWTDRVSTTSIRTLQCGSVHDAVAGAVMRCIHVDGGSDYIADVVFPGTGPNGLHHMLGWDTPWWCESGDLSLDVVNAPVIPFDSEGPLTLQVILRDRNPFVSKKALMPGMRVAQLRKMTPEDAIYTQIYRGIVLEDQAPVSTQGARATSVGSSHVATAGSIGAAAYKTRQRTDDQADLFPDLAAEIAKRREMLHKPKFDQSSAEYKAVIRQVVQDKELVPIEYFEEFCARILEPFSDRFWHDGCAAPVIKDFVARVDIKPGVVLKHKQPYTLSKFDQARMAYLIEEECAEGKLVDLGPGETPPMVSPTFMVDKKGSLIGRRVGAYMDFNAATEDYFFPAPEAEAVLMRATGRARHTSCDCVWGFSIMETTEETALALSVISPFGIHKVPKFPYGPKQGPPIYQHVQEDAVGHEYKANGEKLCDVFFDDTHAADDDDESHYATLEQLFTAARRKNIQYRLVKCRFFQEQVLLLGFICGAHGRSVDPDKTKQLRDWPQYRRCEDVVSHVQFCQYLREFYGPDFPEKTKPLRVYSKKGTDFAIYESDKAAQEAREWLISKMIENVVLVQPDWKAAGRPWESGRPFEAFFDASDLAWSVTLTQRVTPGGTPRPIGMKARTFEEAATRWCAFEREFYGLKEGYKEIEKWVQGFLLFARFDHKNIERAESVFKSRRASKKLINWIADSQVMFSMMVRVFVDGKDNVLADAPSRAPWIESMVRQLALPEQPIKDLIRLFFMHPREIEAAMQNVKKEYRPVAYDGEPQDLHRPRNSPAVVTEVGNPPSAAPHQAQPAPAAHTVPSSSSAPPDGQPAQPAPAGETRRPRPSSAKSDSSTKSRPPKRVKVPTTVPEEGQAPDDNESAISSERFEDSAISSKATGMSCRQSVLKENPTLKSWTKQGPCKQATSYRARSTEEHASSS